ncbi:MAG: hypothetical protein ACLTSX_12380 [Collinsella sp.]
MNDAGLNAATALANGMQSGTVNVDTATSILKAAATGTGLASRRQMSSAASSLPQAAWPTASPPTGSTASGATNTMLSMIALQLTGGTFPQPRELAADIDQGLANGMRQRDAFRGAGRALGEDVISKARTHWIATRPRRRSTA